MENKIKITILIGLIIILGIFIGNNLTNSENNNNTEHFATTNIEIPENFKIINKTNDYIKINNNNNSIIIYEIKNNNLSTEINKFNTKYNTKYNITENKTEINGINCIKTTLQSENNFEYMLWFSKNDKLYRIQAYNFNKDTQKAISTIINSIN